MKKTKIIMFVLLINLFIFSGCTNTVNNIKIDIDSRPKIVTSFYTMYDFTNKIGKDKISIKTIIPPGAELHDWEISSNEIIDIENADVFIYSGAGMEHWVEDVLKSIKNKDLIVVEASKGIELIDGQKHEHEGEQDSHVNESEKHSTDPHVWLNPLFAKKQMENIKNALIEADPQNKDFYNNNYSTISLEIDKLNEEFTTGLQNLTKRDIIVQHEAFGYLCEAYDLNQIGVQGLDTHTEPDPSRMAEIIDYAKQHNIKNIFFEQANSSEIAKTIAKETKATIRILNPLETLTKEQIKAGDDYFSIMRQNLKSIIEASKQE